MTPVLVVICFGKVHYFQNFPVLFCSIRKFKCATFTYLMGVPWVPSYGWQSFTNFLYLYLHCHFIYIYIAVLFTFRLPFYLYLTHIYIMFIFTLCLYLDSHWSKISSCHLDIVMSCSLLEKAWNRNSWWRVSKIMTNNIIPW